MGLLDDAIRDHLDLKRRRGADPAEVERAEREALGPVRRGPDEPPPPLLVEDADLRDDGAWDEHDDRQRALESHDDYEPFDDDFEDEDEELDEHPSVPPPIQMAPPAAPPSPEPLRFSDEGADRAPSAHDPHEPSTAEFFEAAPSAQEHLRQAPAEPEDAREPAPHEEPDATAEFDVRKAMDEHTEPADDDMLEETPEFLSDTPDHDRLWFEQKPPRDFDFDG